MKKKLEWNQISILLSFRSSHLDALLQEGFEQVVGGLGQPKRLDDVEFSKPDGKSSLEEKPHQIVGNYF